MASMPIFDSIKQSLFNLLMIFQLYGFVGTECFRGLRQEKVELFSTEKHFISKVQHLNMAIKEIKRFFSLSSPFQKNYAVKTLVIVLRNSNELVYCN